MIRKILEWAGLVARPVVKPQPGPSISAIERKVLQCLDYQTKNGESLKPSTIAYLTDLTVDEVISTLEGLSPHYVTFPSG